MLNGLVAFSVRNRLLVCLLFVLAAAVGAGALARLPIDAFPDTTPVQVQINAYAPALSPEEIEQQITLPIELAISGLPGLTDVRSISKFGLSQVVATFEDGTPITDSRQFVAERLGTVQMPQGIAPPSLGPISTGLGEIFHYIVRSTDPERTLEDIRTIHDWVIKPELLKTSGVAEINAWGGRERQHHVVVDPNALLEFGLTLRDVLDALASNNMNVGGGVLRDGGQSLLVHGLGRVENSEHIEEIVVRSIDGRPVRIRDVSVEVRIDHEVRRGAVTANGQGEALLGLAFMLMGENAQEVTRGLRVRLEGVRKSLPDDVEVTVVYDRTDLTTAVIATVRHNLLLGAGLVAASLFIILGNLRAGLIVAIVVPFSLLFASLGMLEFGIAASLLSLGAIDFGILVDGSVVMTDANLRNLRDEADRKGRRLTWKEREAIVIASGQAVARPIAFGMGIILLVFVPVLTLEGVEGRMFRPMAWTFIFALVGALLVGLTLSPALSCLTLPARPSQRRERIFDALGAGYSRVLRAFHRARVAGVTGAILLVIGAGWMATRLGGEFVPRLSEGAITLNVVRLAGVSIEESTRYNTEIERLLLEEFPDEIAHVWSRVGSAEVATDPMGLEVTDIFLTLTPRSEWSQADTQAALTALLQETLGDLPGVSVVFSQPIEMRINEMVAGIRSDLGVKIFGDDFDELVRLSDDVQRILLEIPGASDVSGDQITGQPVLRIKVNRDALARYGVAAVDVLAFVEAVGGIHVGEVFEGQRRFDLVARLPDRLRHDAAALESTLVPTESGQRIPLGVLADVSFDEGPATINREWGRRLVRAQCNVADRDVASFVAEAQRRIGEGIALPEGYVISWGGQFENLERARARLMVVVPATLIVVFILLYFSLKRFSDVALIYTAVPFAAVGGVFALWVRDMPFSVSAAVGFIALSGIAVLNGQVLVTAIRDARDRGLGRHDAALDASRQRFRPVLATAVTDALGFIPMAISTGVGAEVQRPLATVVIGGVITSTGLTLLVLPTLYMWLGQRGRLDTSSESINQPAAD